MEGTYLSTDQNHIGDFIARNVSRFPWVLEKGAHEKLDKSPKNFPFQNALNLNQLKCFCETVKTICMCVTYVAACLWPVCTANIPVPWDKSSHRESLSIVACIPMYIVQNKQGCIISLNQSDSLHLTKQSRQIATIQATGRSSWWVGAYLEGLGQLGDDVNHGSANDHL